MRISSTLLVSMLLTAACASEPPLQPKPPASEDPSNAGDGDGDGDGENDESSSNPPDDNNDGDDNNNMSGPDEPSEPTEPDPVDPDEPNEPDEPDEPEPDPEQPDGSFTDVSRCNAESLEWRSGRKTNYESYPEEGSRECIEFSGCEHRGNFAACRGMKSEEWVAAHNIVAAFPDFEGLGMHDLCVRSGDQYIVVTVYDTCGDHDCDGCCTRALRESDQLIDFEKYTNERSNMDDGDVEWADLGPTQGDGCGDEGGDDNND
jgi:hypothetical protein